HDVQSSRAIVEEDTYNSRRAETIHKASDIAKATMAKEGWNIYHNERPANAAAYYGSITSQPWIVQNMKAEVREHVEKKISGPGGPRPPATGGGTTPAGPSGGSTPPTPPSGGGTPAAAPLPPGAAGGYGPGSVGGNGLWTP